MKPGDQLGPYEIKEPLGAGGMGEVYRTLDPRLDQDVAIKVLPEDFAADAERLARFEREAKLLAQLNHSNIAGIYGLEDADGVRFIAMECVEGETLVERLTATGRIEVDEALEIARQIAEALEAAHESGIVHRDLKPANVKVTPEGKVRVLDFGLAKAWDLDAASGSAGGAASISPDLSHSPTMMDATCTGVILGTAAYMSPEQARGKPVDKRADIWAFGCVLYEMLAGKRAFTGETVSDTMAAILKEEPDWAPLGQTTPRSIQQLLRRCLTKDPTHRLHDIADARIEIQDPSSIDDGESMAGAATGNSVSAAKLLGAGAAIGAIGTALILWAVIGQPTTNRVSTTFTVPVPDGYEMHGGESPGLSLSRDGRVLAVVDQGKLYLNRFDGAGSRPIEGTDDAEAPFFSLDGLWVGFSQDQMLKRVSVDGGPLLEIAGAYVGSYAGASWGEDDHVVYDGVQSRVLWRIPAAGGEPQQITTRVDTTTEAAHRWPQVLDGGRQVLFTVVGPSVQWENARIVVQDVATGVRNLVVEKGTHGRYVNTGHVVYVTDSGTPFALPYDLSRHEVTGEAFPVASGVMVGDWAGAASFAVSAGGTAAFVYGSNAERTVFWWADRQGNRLRRLGGAFASGLFFDLSPDGQTLLASELQAGNIDVFFIDVDTGERHSGRLSHRRRNTRLFGRPTAPGLPTRGTARRATSAGSRSTCGAPRRAAPQPRFTRRGTGPSCGFLRGRPTGGWLS